MKLPRIERTCQDCGGTFEATKYAKYCQPCRQKRATEAATTSRTKYVFTPEQDDLIRDFYARKPYGYRARLSRMLRVPNHAIGYRAAQLGVTTPKTDQRWTDEDIQFLSDHLGDWSLYRIAKKLGRSIQSCQYQTYRLRMSVRIREGYTERELAECFGAYPAKIQGWVERGLLEESKRDSGYAFQFTDQQVLRFIMDHPMEFDLARVDQTWFMDLLTSGGVLKAALRKAS